MIDVKKTRKQKPGWVKKIAKDRIERLFELAEKHKTNKSLSKRYITLALNISKKYNVTISRDLKRKFCKKCHTFLILPKIRKERKKNMIIQICKECGYANKRTLKTSSLDRKRRA